ncbi:MAG TPA: hypothetical protein DEP88_04220 [Verrucomicrobiales bacterium]|nr:hypothetical protein [Verrucomicrobiales bacterium]HCI91781.1 hypothetical protein [Verrucomicrobiales bacterium]
MSNRGELYSTLLIKNRHRIYGFIYSMVHDHHASEDLFQDVSTILWEKFDRYVEGSDFAVWAMSIARFCILNWRRKQSRLALPLDDDVLIKLADESVKVSCEFDDLRGYLRDCCTIIPSQIMKVLHARYNRDEKVSSIAKRKNKSVRSIYLTLQKAHNMLLDCVERKMGRSLQ